MQVGGNHYSTSSGIDVFSIADEFELGMREASVVKYIVRHHRKDHAKDVCKAIHCCVRILTDVYGIEIPEDVSLVDLLRLYEQH